MPDCAELLRRYAEDRAEAAFTELVRQQINLVYAIAVRQLNGDVHLAKDVTQSVFTDLARKARSISRQPSVAGWLCRSTQFAAAAAVRAENRRRVREQKAHLMHDFQSEERTQAAWPDLRPLLDRAMSRLSDRDRAALMLRYFEERPFAEIGRRLRLTENASRMRVERALEKLRTSLAGRGITTTAAALAAILSSPPGVAAPSGMAAAIAGNALATVAAVPPAFSLLQLMSTTKTAGLSGLLGLAAIVCVPTVGVAVHELETARRDGASFALANEAFLTTQTQLRRLETSAGAAERNSAQLRIKLAELRASVADNTMSRNPKADGQRFLATFPQARAMVQDMAKVQFSQIYAVFYRTAGLNPAQIEQLESRAAESFLQNLSLSRTGGPGDELPNVSEIPDDQLRQILGDQAFQQIQDYNRMMPAYGWATQMSTSMADTETPLSADQADQLAKIIAANSPDYQSGRRLNPVSIDWDAVQSQAKAAVASSQWSAVQNVLLQAQYQQTLQQAQTSNTPATAR